jgi:hypothetical protein
VQTRRDTHGHARGVLFYLLLPTPGAVVYINGVEVGRSNMPDVSAGAATYSTRATVDAIDVDEATAYPVYVPASALRSGRNVVAVAVHQATPTSADMAFDLSMALLAEVVPPPLTIVRGPYLQLGTEPLTIAVRWRCRGNETSACAGAATAVSLGFVVLSRRFRICSTV